LAVVALGVAACSSDGGGGSTTSPLTLVSECDQICSQLSACGATAATLEAQCMNACGSLSLVQVGCVNPFASYLTCLAGATSVQCQAGGQTVVVTPSSCETYRQSLLACNPGPSPVSACLALPGSGPCTAVGTVQTFCVGAPAACTSPQPNPLGLGTYCCPAGG
jgi:hypothetical protein